MVWNLVFLPKGIKVFFLDSKLEVIHRPQWKEDELSKAIQSYDRLGGVLALTKLSLESLLNPSMSNSSSLVEGEEVDGFLSSLEVLGLP